MSQQPLTHKEKYLSAFEALERNGSAQDPAWLRALRKAALLRFSDLGFPTARRGNEEWKYTDVRPIANGSFQPLVNPAPTGLRIQDLERFTFGESGWSRLVFVDGSYAPQLSLVSSLPTGVSVLNLAEAMATKGDLIEEHLARHADYDAQAFTALNTAFVHDGAFVHVPDGTVVEEPIHLLFITTSQEPSTAVHPRVLIVVGKESKATIIESYGGLSAGRSFTNAVTEVIVGAGASVRHYRVQRQSEEAFHVGTNQVVLGRDSTYASVSTDLGGRLARNNLNVLMGDEGCSCMLNGVYLMTGSQHVDNQVIIDHAKPYTTSRELYKGILDGKSRSVFHGSIIVREGARKVNAHQEDKNLLLSDEAEADTKPAFWIYCDDVRCGHGAACGKLDETALFYLRSRGISERAARSLLTRAFVTQVIDSIDSVPLRTHIDQLVMTTLQEWLGDDGTT